MRCLRLMPWRPADTHKLNLGSHSKAASPEGLGLSAGSFGTFANEHPQLRNSDHVWPKMSWFWWNLSCCLEVACSLAVSWPQAAPKTRPDSVHGWSQKFMQCSSRPVLRPAMKCRKALPVHGELTRYLDCGWLWKIMQSASVVFESVAVNPPNQWLPKNRISNILCNHAVRAVRWRFDCSRPSKINSHECAGLGLPPSVVLHLCHRGGHVNIPMQNNEQIWKDQLPTWGTLVPGWLVWCCLLRVFIDSHCIYIYNYIYIYINHWTCVANCLENRKWVCWMHHDVSNDLQYMIWPSSSCAVFWQSATRLLEVAMWKKEK